MLNTKSQECSWTTFKKEILSLNNTNGTRTLVGLGFYSSTFTSTLASKIELNDTVITNNLFETTITLNPTFSFDTTSQINQLNMFLSANALGNVLGDHTQPLLPSTGMNDVLVPTSSFSNIQDYYIRLVFTREDTSIEQSTVKIAGIPFRQYRLRTTVIVEDETEYLDLILLSKEKEYDGETLLGGLIKKGFTEFGVRDTKRLLELLANPRVLNNTLIGVHIGTPVVTNLSIPANEDTYLIEHDDTYQLRLNYSGNSLIPKSAIIGSTLLQVSNGVLSLSIKLKQQTTVRLDVGR